jgi:hypothetical protein
MGKIIDYKIVTVTMHRLEGDAPNALTAKVNELIARGWEPLGGVGVSGDSDRYSQAMVRRKES